MKIDEQGRKVKGKYEIVEHSGKGKWYTVRRDGHTLPGKYNSIKTAEEAVEANKEKMMEHKTKVVREIY